MKKTIFYIAAAAALLVLAGALGFLGGRLTGDHWRVYTSPGEYGTLILLNSLTGQTYYLSDKQWLNIPGPEMCSNTTNPVDRSLLSCDAGH